MSQRTQEKKLIAVVGATGCQGKSVLQYLVQSGRYKVRALTRDTTSAKALNLRSYGSDVELWKCDMFNSDEVIKAFTGCWGAYLLTDFWWDPSKMVTQEVKVGRILIDAAVEANLKFAIWSSLHNVQIISEGRLQVPHFTNKAIVEEYARIEFKDRNIQTKFGFVYPGLYMQNFLRKVLPGVGLRINSDGVLENLPLPINADTKVPLINIDELGKWVLPMFDRYEQFQGKSVLASNDYITIPQFMSLIATRLNMKYNFKTCTYDEFYDKTNSNEIVHMFRFFNEFGYYGGAKLNDFSAYTKDIWSIEEAVNKLDWDSVLRPGFTQQVTSKIGETVGAVKETVKGAFSGQQKSTAAE